MQTEGLHVLGLSPSCRGQRNSQLFIICALCNRDLQEIIHKSFVYFCLFLSGLNHRQWKYSFNLICRFLKLNGCCLFCCATNKYVCIYGLSISCLFCFSCHTVLQFSQDFWSNNDLITDIRTFDLHWHTSEEDYSCQGCTYWQFLLSAASFFWMFFRKEK